MYLIRILFGVLTTWCTVYAITVPIDRADVQLHPTRSSMIANGWRPLTGYENLGTNVSPPSSLDRNAAHHPVLGKLQEHIHAASEKGKSQTNSGKSQEYSLPSMLGSFSVFGHAATKSRAKPKEHHKPSAAATTHYSFLIPPPRDSFRFDVDPHRKAILRDNEPFLRQPSFISQGHQGDANGAPFFSKGSGFATSTTHIPSFSKGRPFAVNGFGIQQNFHPQRPQQFEAHKTSNTKSYLQPPGLESPLNFAPDQNKNLDAGGFPRFHGHQPHSAQVLNGGGGNFYSQVDHPPQFKGSYERDPSFLVHESHEISYVTPPSDFNYNFRPSLPYDNLVPPNLFPSTAAPNVNPPNKFVPSQASPQAQGVQILPAGTYYLQGEQRLPGTTSWPQQKAKFTTEINEVLPKKNSPAKFRPDNAPSDPLFGIQTQVSAQPQATFVRPSAQPQFENPIVPAQPQQTTPEEPEYETPESISLKHFNEQQFLLQQQLVQQDRKRLQEQELQRQQELQRKQVEENRKRQEEMRLFEEQQKEEERKEAEQEEKQRQQEQAEREQQKLQEQYELRKQQEMQEKIEQRRLQQQQQQQRAQEQLEYQKQEQLRKQLEEEKKKHEQQFAIEQEEYHRPSVNQDRTAQHENHKPAQDNFEFSTIESTGTKETPRPEVESQVETEVRPYRPKFPQRGIARRRRPSTPGYNAVRPTEASSQNLGSYHPATDSPVQTTAEPDATVHPVSVTSRPRIRRPGQPLKRRRLFTTTSTPEYESSSSTVLSSSIREPESGVRYQTAENDSIKRRRPRPTQSTAAAEETVTERHYIRRRPTGVRQRVHPGEPFEAEVVTEIVRPTRIIYKDTTEWENYPESFKKNSQEVPDTSSVTSQTLPSQDLEQDQISTENVQVYEFSTETFTPEIVTNYEEPQQQQQEQQQIPNNGPTQSQSQSQSQNDEESNIPLEQLFDKPEENHVEPFTTPEDVLRVPTTTAIATTTETPTTTVGVASSTKQSFRPIRPLKYGNATRPRFSIKDYRSRLDYKSRLSQLSTTEAAPASAPGRRRFTTEKPEESSAAGTPRETTRGYKYMSRASYKPTTSTPGTNAEEVEHETTTERQNRFTPRRKLNMNLYRSRVTTTTSQSSRVANEDVRQSTTRPENIYSSAIRRPRPSYKNRNSEAGHTEEATEMTAEETSFYSSVTSSNLRENPAKNVPKEENNSEGESSNLTESANEILKKEEEDSGAGNKSEDTELKISEENESDITTVIPTEKTQETQQDEAAVNNEESIPTIPASTETSQDAEDALISQRIANLTSSSSKLYEPGMFKAVSPVTESRVISPHFAIVTDEPTLPIEAFFQVLGKKDE